MIWSVTMESIDGLLRRFLAASTKMDEIAPASLSHKQIDITAGGVRGFCKYIFYGILPCGLDGRDAE